MLDDSYENDDFFFCCVWVFVCVCVFKKNILYFFWGGVAIFRAGHPLHLYF